MDDANLFYRMRSLDRLLGKEWRENDGKDGELDKQEIYFASPNELNDPMEGFGSIVFKGDKILWHNFFKHYVMCLERRCNVYILCKELYKQPSFDLNDMVIHNAFDDLYSQISQKMFNDIYKDFKLDCSKEIDTIATIKTPITKDTLYYYLKIIHFVALAHINKHYIENGFIQNHSIDYFGIAKVHRDFLTPLIKCWEKYNIGDGQNKELDEMCRYAKYAGDSEIIKNLLNAPPEINMTMYDFPISYLNYLDELIYPAYYVACFLKKSRNSSLWGHYADGHKGVCLIFKNSANGIKLTDLKPLPFEKINYNAEFETINFFENLSNLAKFQILKWHCGENNQKSSVVDKIFKNEEEWRKDCRKTFYKKIVTKTKDWQYENEYRLVIDCQNKLEKQERIFQYNFDDLEGIIFGMETPQDAKAIIIDIIWKKCIANNRKEFKIYQAYYCKESGDIQYKLYRLIQNYAQNLV